MDDKLTKVEKIGAGILIILGIVMGVYFIKGLIWLLVSVLHVMLVSPMAALGVLVTVSVVLYGYFKYMDSK
jgi:hypothetical protein